MKNLNKDLLKAARNYIEAWFDEHPEPHNVELFQFELDTGVVINVYAADLVYDTWMLKIEMITAQGALNIESSISELCKCLGVTLIRINRNLFLFTDRRF